MAQSVSILNQVQHENAEAFRLVGFARQHDALHLLRVFAPLVAQLHITYSRLIMFVCNIIIKLSTYRLLSVYNNATDIKRAANTETMSMLRIVHMTR